MVAYNKYVTLFRARIAAMKTALVDITVNDSTIQSGYISTVIEPVWWMGNIYEDYDTYTQSLSQCSQEQRFVFAIIWYEAEVLGGGHVQFFTNAAGIVWQEALLGLEAIGQQDAFAILNESTKRLGGSPSFDRDIRCNQLRIHDATFTDLDDAFRKIELHTALRTYIAKHRESFFFNGKIAKYVA